jgi:hypothetical protein
MYGLKESNNIFFLSNAKILVYNEYNLNLSNTIVKLKKW